MKTICPLYEIELNHIWVFIFCTNSMYCWCEVRSIVLPAACLEIRPGWSLLNSVAAAQTQQSVIQEQNVTWVKKLQIRFFFLFFPWLLKGVKESTDNNYQQKIAMLVSWNPLWHGNHGTTSSFTKHNSIRAARKTEELNKHEPQKTEQADLLKFGMPL